MSLRVHQRPTVSVIIPSHRPALYLEARASVHAQTFREYAILSTESELWWPSKINDAARGVASEWMLFLCDDDKLRPEFLDATLAMGRQGFDVISTDVRTFGQYGGARARLGGWSLEAFRRGNPTWITTLIRTALWRQLTPPGAAGAFDEHLIWYDYGFWYECYRSGASHAHISEELWDYREDGQQGTQGVDAAAALAQIHAKYPELKP